MALEKRVTGDMTVAELLDRFPETARVFFRRRMACVGCPLEKFDRLKDVACVYHIQLPDLLWEFNKAVVYKDG